MKKEPGNLPEGAKGLLAGDIGGTKTHLGLYAIDAGGPRKLATVTYLGAAWRAYELATQEGDKHGDRQP